MFLKKLTLIRKDRRVSMNDDMNDAVFVRNARAVQLGNKAFNMSQPMLGVRMNLDNEDHEDVSATSCSSPTSGSHKHPDATPSTAPTKTLPPVQSHESVISRAPAGLPSTSQQPSPKSVDGLPPSQQPHFASKPQPVQNVVSVSKPTVNEAASARSIAGSTSVKSGLTDSDSHESSDVSVLGLILQMTKS